MSKKSEFEVSFELFKFTRVISFSWAKEGKEHIIKKKTVIFLNFSKVGKKHF